jgi:hypothetical protein
MLQKPQERLTYSSQLTELAKYQRDGLLASPVSLHAHRFVSSTDSFVRLYPFLSILLLAEDLYRALQR